MMWLGEQITERGIGNGISLIIFIGIIARFPSAIFDEFKDIGTDAGKILSLKLCSLHSLSGLLHLSF